MLSQKILNRALHDWQQVIRLEAANSRDPGGDLLAEGYCFSLDHFPDSSRPTYEAVKQAIVKAAHEAGVTLNSQSAYTANEPRIVLKCKASFRPDAKESRSTDTYEVRTHPEEGEEL